MNVSIGETSLYENSTSIVYDRAFINLIYKARSEVTGDSIGHPCEAKV